MICPIQSEQAFAFLDQELAPTDEQSLTDHLVHCSECARQVQEARLARESWQEARAEDLDEFTWTRMDKLVARQIKDDASGAPNRMPFTFRFSGVVRGVAWAGVGAACALTLYMTVGLESEPTVSTDSPIAVAALQEPNVGDVLTTGTESRTIQIAAAKLTMNPSAVCRVATRSETATRIELVSGRISFDVGPRKPGAVFQVQAGTVSVTVKGTRFDVERTLTGTVHVSVAHGLVAVQQANEPETLLRAGEHIARTEHPVDPVEPTRIITEDTPRDALEPASNEQDTSLAQVVPQEAPDVAQDKRNASSQNQKKANKRTKDSGAKKKARAKPTADRSTPVASATKLAKPREVRVIEINVDDPNVTYVEVDNTDTSAKQALKSILRALGSQDYGSSIQQLRKWLSVHKAHRLRTTARYAIGYCEFRRGRKEVARRIFAKLPKGNRWIRTIGDFDNPPKPY